jgi:hypothetical protein
MMDSKFFLESLLDRTKKSKPFFATSNACLDRPDVCKFHFTYNEEGDFVSGSIMETRLKGGCTGPFFLRGELAAISKKMGNIAAYRVGFILVVLYKGFGYPDKSLDRSFLL